MGDVNNLKPIDWGWELRNKILFSRRMDAPLAPPYLLKVNSLYMQGGVCHEKCSCHRYVIKCINTCANCQGRPAQIPKVKLGESELEGTT